MVQVIKGKEVTLLQLQENFGLERTSDANFFREWQEDLPELNDFDRQCLDEVKVVRIYTVVRILKHLGQIVANKK